MLSFQMETFVDERWLSVEEIAIHLGIKEILAHKVGVLWKFRRTEIDAWVISGKASDQPKPR